MKNEEIRKLLGGYATNTLSESERRVLFEAALDDQELFNALEDEQALKQLLADPASRSAIQRALEEPIEKQHSPWWSQRWVWGGMAGAVAAAVLIVALVHQNRPEEKSGRIEIASTQEPAKSLLEQNAPVGDREVTKAPEQISPKTSRRLPKAKEYARDSLAPPSIGQLARSASPPQTSLQEQPGANSRLRLLTGTVGGAPPATAKFQPDDQTALRYLLVRRDANLEYSALPANAELKTGDAVRITVQPGVSGSLALEQLDTSGEWKRVFPQAGQGMTVTANTRYLIPDSPLEVQNNAEKFRLVLISESAPRAKTPANRGASETARETSIVTPPLTVDIAIGPGKIP